MRFRNCLAILVFAASAAVAATEPAFELSRNRIEAFGLRAEAEVVLIGVIKQNLEWIGRTIPVVEYGTTDGSGRISFDLESGSGRASAWALVDLADGEALILSPYESDGRDSALKPGGRGLKSSSESLVVLVTRPGAGAWYGRVVDGGGLDADGVSDGTTSLSPALLRAPSPQLAQEAPSALAAGDLTIAIDFHTLEVQTVRTAGLADSR